MEHIVEIGNVFYDSNTNHFYKKDQTFKDYIYFDCFSKECNGRLQLNCVSKLKRIVFDHKPHSTAAVFNEVQILKVNKLVLKMATEDEYKNCKPNEIYSKVIQHFGDHQMPTLPLNHKTKSLKSIRNARYRQQDSSNISQKRHTENNANVQITLSENGENISHPHESSNLTNDDICILLNDRENNSCDDSMTSSCEIDRSIHEINDFGISNLTNTSNVKATSAENVFIELDSASKTTRKNDSQINEFNSHEIPTSSLKGE